MQYKIIDTTDNKSEGAYIDIPDEALFVGSKIPVSEMIFEIDNIRRDGDMLTLSSSNYSVSLKATNNV
jgi:hypothetical protein